MPTRDPPDSSPAVRGGAVDDIDHDDRSIPFQVGRHAACSNALSYGYSVTATASFGMLARTAAAMSVGHIFMFVFGNGVAFAVVKAIVTRGFRHECNRTRR